MQLRRSGRMERSDAGSGVCPRPSARGASGAARRWIEKCFRGGGNAMPRYFFDLVDDKKIYDKKGVSLPNDKAAREYAKTFARELMETKADLLGESWQAWSVQVCNG